MIELSIILTLLGMGGFLDRRDNKRAAEMQLDLDKVHHGTELKPYDWQLES